MLGRTFKQGSKILDLKNYTAFYEGEEVSEEKALDLLRRAKNANIVGEQAISMAKKAIAFDSKAIVRIAGVPHLQIYFV